MVHGGVRLFFHVLGGLGLLLLLAVAALTWRLSQGPLRLDAVTPYLEEALSLPGGDLRVRLGHTLLYWESLGETMDLRVSDVRAVDGEGDEVAAVPELALTVAPAALLRGEIRLTSVEVINPYLQLVREADGSLRLGLWYPAGAGEEPVPEAEGDRMEGTAILRAVVAGLTGEDGLGAASDLRAVRVAGARGRLIDNRLGADWTVPDASIELYRGESGSVGLAATLAVALPGDQDTSMRLDLVGDYDPVVQMVDLGVTFAGLRPSAVAPVSSALAPLAALDLPLDGTATLTLAVTHTLELRSAGLSVSGGAGHIRLPEPLSTTYAVRSLAFAGSAAADLDQILIDNLRLDLEPPDGTADPDAEGRPAVLSLSATLDERPPGGDVDAPTSAGEGVKERSAPERGTEIGAETGGATASEPLIPLGAMIAGEVLIAAQDVPVDALTAWWPETVAPNPRRWIVANLSGGRLTEGRWGIGLAGPILEDLEPTTVEGTAHTQGVRVRYMPEMPPVEAAVADLSFHADRVDVAVGGGTLYGLRVTGGSIALTDLNHPTTPRAAIDLTIGGPLTDALRVIDSKPLGYATRLGISPRAADGAQTTRLRMAFPLINDLRLDELDVLAEAEARDATLRGAVFGRDLTEADLSLTVDADSLEAKGQALVAGIPAGFAWRENFAGKPFRSRYAVRARVAEDKRSIFGLDFPPLTPPFIQGPAGVDLEYTVFKDGMATIGAQVDLAETRMRLPGFDWIKAPGVPAQATVALRLQGGTVRDVSRFTVRSGDAFLADGKVRLSEAGVLDTITLDRLTIGETDMDGAIVAQSDGSYAVDVKGHAFDATPFLQGQDAASAKPVGAAGTVDAEGTESGGEAADDLPPVSLKAAFDVVWLSEDGTIENVTARLRRQGGRTLQADVKGLLEGREPVTLRMGRDPDAADREFAVRTADAGALIRAAGLLGTMRGGDLDLKGRVLDSGRAEGVLRVTDFRLVDAPVLARLLSVAALTGILEALSGDGLAFSELEAPFILDDSLLTVKDFRSSGPSLGLTGDGTINLDTDRLALRGTIVPAYALNSLLGRLPLVGGLLSGFEAGGGLFAASYTVEGPVGDPQVAVNPLSALAPGFLRGLFSGGLPDAAPVPDAAPKSDDADGSGATGVPATGD